MNSELPGTAAFDAASQFVTREDVSSAIPCGNNVDDFVSAVRKYTEAGFTDVALIQIGGDAQDPFFDWWNDELRSALPD